MRLHNHHFVVGQSLGATVRPALHHNRFIGASAALFAVGLPALWNPSPVSAQTARSVYFYSSGGGSSAKRGAWGNGTSQVARNVDYEGAEVLQVTTRNLNEGLRFDLNTPVEIGPYMTTGYIRLRVRFSGGMSGRMQGGMGQGGMGQGGMGGPGGYGPPGDYGGPEGFAPPEGFDGQNGFAPPDGFAPGGGEEFATPFGAALPLSRQTMTRAQAQVGAAGRQRGGAPVYNGPPGAAGAGRPPRTTTTPPQGYGGPPPGYGGPPPGYGGTPPGYGGTPGGMGEGGFPGMRSGPMPQRTAITRLQCTLILDRGVMVGGMDVDLNQSKPDENGWRLLTLPMRSMRATPGAGGSVRRVLLTSDKEDSWYLAQAALVIETGEMTVSLRQPTDAPGTPITEITVKPGPISLVADVEAGAADPQVEWNFDADNVGNLPAANAAIPGLPGAATQGGPPPGYGGPPPGYGGPPPGYGGPPQGYGGPPGEGMAEVPAGPRVDARGLIGKFDYPAEEQNYRVEVTVRDRSGKKQPVTASLLVKVRG